MASENNTFPPEASSLTGPEILSQLSEAWKKSEEDSLQKVTDLEYMLTKRNEDFDVLIYSDLRHQEEINVLKKKIEGLEDEVKRKVNEIDELKMVNDQDKKKINIYREIVLDLNVKVLHLQKLGNELMGSGCSAVDLEVKKLQNIVAETSRSSPPPGFKGILDPKPKKANESKLPVIIEIDDDDEEYDHGDRDLTKVSSSKRRHESDEVERDDNEDDKCISVLKRKKVSEKVTKDHKKPNYDDKIPWRTQPTSHSKSPFCDSSGSNSDDENAKISATMDLPEDRWETEEDMVIEFSKDYHLCWNAICALHEHVVILCPDDASRISSLLRKKLISNLSPFDLHECQKFAVEYSAQIFDIYKEKSDKCFPAL